MNGREPGKPVPPSIWRLAGMGTELAAAVIGGCLLGWWIDRARGSGHWGVLIGATIGIVGGLYNMIRKAIHESLHIGQNSKRSRDGVKEQQDSNGRTPGAGEAG
jgi:F0F1-type ATP synthase assembly protein I